MNTCVTAGWVFSSAMALIDSRNDIRLAVASLYNGNYFEQIQKNDVLHFLIPCHRRNGSAICRETKKYWVQISKEFQPDIIHIHGTEMPDGLSYIKACGVENVVVSIQGLVSIIARYYFGGIKKMELYKSITLRDLLRLDTVFSQKNNMSERGEYEREMLKSVNHVIGRTSWDKSHSWAINQQINYHFCNEMLRPSFFKYKWSINNCERNSILISQANYPIKGFHQLIKALPLVLEQFPDTKIYVAGSNFVSDRGLRINGYGKYINELIRRYRLTKHVTFTGLLNEAEMSQLFLKSHIFVNPSIIENSSNSVCEAQLLGVPCVASNVGGTSDLINHGVSGLLYRYDEFELLASNICKVFSNNVFACQLSEKGREIAAIRHNRENIASTLFEIYLEILKK